MGIFYSTILMQSGLPPVSQVISPEAMLVTSVTVACLGLAVMLLTRQRTEALATESVAEAEDSAPAEPLALTSQPSALHVESPEAPVSGVTASPANTVRSASMYAEGVEPENVAAAGTASLRGNRSADDSPIASSPGEPRVPGGAPRGPAHGASALIARVASMLPAGAPAPESTKSSPPRASRSSSGFKPAARFSRSQQAFLRIPVILTGRDASGNEFREEACTLILLPQGAVIPMRQKVRTGERLTLSIPERQKEVACEVFGVQPGPDGKMHVEIEFPEPQRSMWPVSFPAWAGKTTTARAANQPERAGAPSRAPALDSSGT